MIWCCHLLFIWISAVRQCVYPMMRCGVLAINQVKLVMSCLLSVWSTVVGCLNWPGRWATVIDTIIDGYRLSFPCSRFYQTALAQQEHHPNARPNKLSIQCVCVPDRCCSLVCGLLFMRGVGWCCVTPLFF